MEQEPITELATSSPRTGSGRTGGRCPVSGPYRSSRNARVIVFVRRGQAFPRDSDSAETTWTLVTETKTSLTAIDAQ